MQAITDHMATFHIAVKVVNGGYIVHAYVRGDNDDDWSVTTSIFTDVTLMTDYVRRVARDMEGAGNFNKLGPLHAPQE